jgi:hypothetical protein
MKMAKSENREMMLKRRLERIIRDAKRTSEKSKERVAELDREWEEMEERHREARRHSY